MLMSGSTFLKEMSPAPQHKRTQWDELLKEWRVKEFKSHKGVGV